jgi:uncharacterized membrane protein
MTNLFVAAIFLVGTHLGIASSQLRDQLIHSVGETAYRILYSLVAAVALIWLIAAYTAAPFLPLWEPGPMPRLVPVVVMPVALLLVVCSVSQPNPTAVGQGPDVDAGEPAKGILRITRHPMMWGIALWATAHILATGDEASVIFFGSLGTLALLGTVFIDARKTRENPPGWGVYLQSTSNLPFQAIVERRQRLVLREIGLRPVLVALALYLLLITGHPWLFGAPALG